MRGLVVLVLAGCVGDASNAFAPSFAEAQTIAVTYTASCGTVSTAGMYTAPSSGSCTVTAKGSGLTATATVTVLVPPPSVGTFAAGFWDYPSTVCNTMGVTGVARGITPSQVTSYLATAQRCGVKVVLVPNRAMITTTGTTKAPFSIDSAKKATDAFAAVLTPGVLATYDATLIGLNLADDYGSTDQWGGTTVSPAQIQAWALYTKQKMPTLRLGVRVEATWVTTALAGTIDYAWAQYHKGKGDATTYFNKQRDVARALGISLVTGVNSTHSGGAGTTYMTPQEIRTYMGMAVQRPESCGAFAWDYDTQQMAVTGMTDAWVYVLGLAKQRGSVPCKHL